MSADGSKQAWLGWLLSHRLPLVGDWLLRRAADALVRAGSGEAGHRLVEALTAAPVARQGILREALARLRTPAARAGACEAWAGCPDPALVELLGPWGELPGLSPRARLLLALHLGRLERLDPADDSLADELIAVCLHGGALLAGRARAWIIEQRPAALLERAARHWLVSRDPLLADVIEHAGYVPPPGHPARLMVLLYLGRIAPARQVGSDEVPSLLVAAGDADPVIACRARQALAELERPEARDALCRHALEGDDRAELIAVEAGYRPGGAHEHALFLFLTRQWSAYEVLDFDGSLLRVAYEAAPDPVRRRLARRAQQEGRRELVQLLAGERQRSARRLALGEWRTLIDLLAQFREWPRLWELTHSAPPARTVEIVERLAVAGWTADDDLARLSKLAAGPARLRFGPGEDCQARWDRVVPGPVGCLAWHPCKPWLACVAGTGTAVQVLDLDAQRRRQLPGPQDVLCLVVSADGRTLAGGSRGGHVYLWTLPECLTPRTLYGCAGPVNQVALTPDGKTLIGLAEDFAQVWDLAEDDPECKPLAFGGGLTCLAVSPDGAVLAVGGDDGSVWLAWHLPDGELKDALGGHQAAVVELAFRRDGRVLASRDAGGQGRLWSLAPPGCLDRFPADALLEGLPDFEADPAAVLSRRACRQALWQDVEGKSLLARIEGGALVAGGAPEGSGLCCLASSPAHWLAAGGDDGGVAVWPPPGHWAQMAKVPLDEWPLTEWERVRQALARGGLAGDEARSLAFLDVLLARRWRHEVHATEDAPGPGPYDISVEEVRP